MQISSSSSSNFFSSLYADEPALITLTIVVVVVVVLLFKWWLHWKEQRLRLPPGSMGLPYIGETLRLYTENPNSFFATRQNKYGDIFKTHILGCPCVMISSPEAARMVLVSKAHLFKPTYPPSKERMIGPEALFFHQGPYHSTLKRLVQSSFMPSALRPTVSHIELLVLQTLSSWTSQKSINTLEYMKRYAFDVAIMSAFGDKEEPTTIDVIKLLYQRLERGYNSMPLDLPGTLFHKSMKARIELSEELRKVIEKRRENGREEGGLLGVLLGAKDQKRNGLSDSQIADNIIGVIFAATDTTASVLTWLLKYLHDHPNLLQEVSVSNFLYVFFFKFIFCMHVPHMMCV
ncbi:Cytochrome P450 [Arabidopsis thaliana x Arabidopsis arenosa]|nr:Cytochrome P450 [Arabidopsis thaliana x Arabidopsis arenosa]